jgi:hypothetical protein
MNSPLHHEGTWTAPLSFARFLRNNPSPGITEGDPAHLPWVSTGDAVAFAQPTLVALVHADVSTEAIKATAYGRTIASRPSNKRRSARLQLVIRQPSNATPVNATASAGAYVANLVQKFSVRANLS